MLKQGLDANLISEYTGIALEKVEEIIKKVK